MQILIERTALLAALNRIRHIIPAKPAHPILGTVLLGAAGETLSLRTTDLDLEIQTSAVAEVQQAGAVAVGCRDLYKAVAALPDDFHAIELRLDGDLVRLYAAGAALAFPATPAGEFPDPLKPPAQHRVRIPTAPLLAMVERVRHAIGTDGARYYLAGIHLATHSTGLRAVTTDGYRLAIADTSLPPRVGKLPGITVPSAAINELRRVLKGCRIRTTITASDDRIRFEAGATTITTKIVEGEFPDYERTIPLGDFKRAEFRIAPLMAALKQLLPPKDDEGHRTIKMAFTRDSLALSSVHDTVDVAIHYRDTPADIGINPDYLLDALKQCSGDEAYLLIQNGVNPVILHSFLERTPVFAFFVIMTKRC